MTPIIHTAAHEVLKVGGFLISGAVLSLLLESLGTTNVRKVFDIMLYLSAAVYVLKLAKPKMDEILDIFGV